MMARVYNVFNLSILSCDILIASTINGNCREYGYKKILLRIIEKFYSDKGHISYSWVGYLIISARSKVDLY